MSGTTAARFDYLDRLPREIRDMIFRYMVQNTIECRTWTSPPGLCIRELQSHLLSSPWITLNKQYCVEYISVLLGEMELFARIMNPKRKGSSSAPREPNQLNACLRTISHRFKTACLQIETGTPRQNLFPYIKGICLHYRFAHSIFGRGFGKTERRHLYFPPSDCFARPVRQLRRYHEDYNISADKLSIHINYGGPDGAIMAFLDEQENQEPFVHLRYPQPVEVRVQVDDYEASVAALESQLESLRQAVESIIRGFRIHYIDPRQLRDVAILDAMIEKDTIMLRRVHLKFVDEITTFWKGQDGWYELDDMFRIAESWASQSESDGLVERSSTSVSVDEIDMQIRGLRRRCRH